MPTIRKSAPIHRTTHETIHTGVNDALALFHAHVGGRIGIHLRHEIEKIEGERDERVANDRTYDGTGDQRSDNRAGQSDEHDKRHKNKEDNDFLCRFSCDGPACRVVQKSGRITDDSIE